LGNELAFVVDDRHRICTTLARDEQCDERAHGQNAGPDPQRGDEAVVEALR